MVFVVELVVGCELVEDEGEGEEDEEDGVEDGWCVIAAELLGATGFSWPAPAEGAGPDGPEQPATSNTITAQPILCK